MANVSFHRTDKKQERIKTELVRRSIVSKDDMDNYKGVRLGDDSTVIVFRPCTEAESELLSVRVTGARKATVCTVYAMFDGDVIAARQYVETAIRLPISAIVPNPKTDEPKPETAEPEPETGK